MHNSSTIRRPNPRRVGVATCLIAFLAVVTLNHGARLTAQEITHIEGLGSLSFPNSGAPEAQHDFLRGVLLLHSFEYDFAATAFQRAQELDPDFALAYWGEAMTYTHAVWNEKDPAAARHTLGRYASTAAARAAKAPTDRERAYMQAVDVLYGDGLKARLDTLYSREMEALAEAYPEDLEAQAFYALSLLGLSQGARDVPTYIRAGTIALDVFGKNPGHPGGAHYTIHSFDDPTHAPLAMKAARAYGPIAPDAGHAQHMTTHIFLALGMWDDVVEANIRADGVVDRNRAEDGLPPTDCGHYDEWLMYGYQQQGRYEDAKDLLMRCFGQSHDDRLSPAARARAAFSYTFMRGLYLTQTENWQGEAARSSADMSGNSASDLLKAWGDGLVALHNGDRALAQNRLLFIQEKGAGVAASYISPYIPVWQGTLEAFLLLDGEDTEGALAAARAAADFEAALPIDFGPPIAAKPARELEGEILLELGRAEDAMAAFSQALGRTPNRLPSLVGYAKAAELAGHSAAARDARAQLNSLLGSADAEVKVRLMR